jgi:DNA-binding NarL/FixJ family response regulator
MDNPARDTSTPVGQIRVLIVDSHPLLRAGVRTLLEAEPGMEVVGEAGSIEQALTHCQVRKPDVVLMDLEEPTAAAIEGLQRLSRECGYGALVILGRRNDDEEVFRAVVAGAAGHVGNSSAPDELLSTIRNAASGGEPIRQILAQRPAVARRVLDTLRVMSERRPPVAEEVVTLSARELTVLRYAADGLTNRKIGRALGLSEHTIKSIFSQILAKLGMTNRTEAVVHAVREGWITVAVETPGESPAPLPLTVPARERSSAQRPAAEVSRLSA